MSIVTMKQLLEAGVHFGHRTRRWNPKMRPYIFTERSKIHIIDLHQTMLQIEDAYNQIRDVTAKGGTVLFVGTKRQAQAAIREEAERARMPYVDLRWLGGTLTNWSTIRQRIEYLLQLERRWDAGEFVNLTKKEQLSISREIEKLNRRLGGLKTMGKIPDLIFIVDTHTENLAVKEAAKLKIPIFGMVDTNSDPDPISHVIPSNDDAIRAVKLIVSVMASAADEGLRMREIDLADSGQVSQQELEEMEQYLGPSTLAKIDVAEAEEQEEVLSEDLDVVPVSMEDAQNGAQADGLPVENPAESAGVVEVDNGGADGDSGDPVPDPAAKELVVSEPVDVSESRDDA